MNELILSADEEDLAVEMFNIGMNRAAQSLTKLSGKEIFIDIPGLSFSTVEAFSKTQKMQEVVGVSQRIDGGFSGVALLVFPPQSSHHIVASMLEFPYEPEVLVEMYQDAMTEIGNIILNACIGAIGNWTATEFLIGLPEFKQGRIEELIASTGGLQQDDLMLNIEINMQVPHLNEHGSVMFILGPVSLPSLKMFLDDQLTNYSFMSGGDVRGDH